MYMNIMRSGGSVSVPAEGAAFDITSNHGKASAAPAPRSTVLLEIRLAFMVHLAALGPSRT
jgi:hypothetical protein